MDNIELEKVATLQGEGIALIAQNLLEISRRLLCLEVTVKVHRQMFEKLGEFAPGPAAEIVERYDEIYATEWEKRVLEMEKTSPNLAAQFDKDRPLITPDEE